MSVKFKDVLGRYAPVTARELVRFCDVCEVQRCFGRYAPVTARELVRFCDVYEVQRCFGRYAPVTARELVRFSGTSSHQKMPRASFKPKSNRNDETARSLRGLGIAEKSRRIIFLAIY
jgi:hypothetical protein